MTAGTLPAAAGGTGLTAPGTSGNILTSNGTAWTSAAPAAGGVTSIVAGTGISVSGTTAVTVNVVTTLGAVGTYGFFVYSGGAATISPGTTYAGSLLYYSSNIPAGCDLYALIKNSATNPSGTWRAMGGWNSASTLLQTLFVRIS
jgi:hypothetical protein